MKTIFFKVTSKTHGTNLTAKKPPAVTVGSAIHNGQHIAVILNLSVSCHNSSLPYVIQSGYDERATMLPLLLQLVTLCIAIHHGRVLAFLELSTIEQNLSSEFFDSVHDFPSSLRHVDKFQPDADRSSIRSKFEPITTEINGPLLNALSGYRKVASYSDSECSLVQYVVARKLNSCYLLGDTGIVIMANTTTVLVMFYTDNLCATVPRLSYSKWSSVCDSTRKIQTTFTPTPAFSSSSPLVSKRYVR